MPTKTFRGKRHIRARASVAVGREKRRVRKLGREIDALALFVNVILPKIIADAVPAIIEAVNIMRQAAINMSASLAPAMQDIVRIISENPSEFARRFHELSETKDLT